jgi:hypothetical protein
MVALLVVDASFILPDSAALTPGFFIRPRAG